MLLSHAFRSTQKYVQRIQFWIWVSLFGFITIHLYLLQVHVTTADLWNASLLYWLATIYLIYTQSSLLSKTADTLSIVIGSGLLTWILYKSIHVFTFDFFLRIYPFLSILGLALITAGIKNLSRYIKQFILVSFLIIPWELLHFLNLSLVTAKFSTGILTLLGFPAQREGVWISLPNGSIEVYEGCSGIRLIVQLIGITILLLVLVPSRKLLRIFLPIIAVLLGFGVNGLRVSLLAILAVIPDPEALDYWHHGDGSLIFSGLTVLCLGISYSLLNREPETTHLSSNTFDPIEPNSLSQKQSIFDSKADNSEIKNNGKKVLAFLVLPIIGSIWMVLKVFFYGQVNSIYQFPASIPLSEWKHYATGPVNVELVRPPAHILGQFIAGKRYVYGQEGLRLDIEMRYLKETDGDLKSFIQSQSQTISSSLRRHPQLGFYLVYHRYGRAYLTACLNPQGGSTVTSDQFRLNRILYDGRPTRILTWLQGETNLQDRRCLWAYLSIPLDPTLSPKTADLLLETTWVEWAHWWIQNYPSDDNNPNQE